MYKIIRWEKFPLNHKDCWRLPNCKYHANMHQYDLNIMLIPLSRPPQLDYLRLPQSDHVKNWSLFCDISNVSPIFICKMIMRLTDKTSELGLSITIQLAANSANSSDV